MSICVDWETYFMLLGIESHSVLWPILRPYSVTYLVHSIVQVIKNISVQCSARSLRCPPRLVRWVTHDTIWETATNVLSIQTYQDTGMFTPFFQLPPLPLAHLFVSILLLYHVPSFQTGACTHTYNAKVV